MFVFEAFEQTLQQISVALWDDTWIYMNSLQLFPRLKTVCWKKCRAVNNYFHPMLVVFD